MQPEFPEPRFERMLRLLDNASSALEGGMGGKLEMVSVSLSHFP